MLGGQFLLPQREGGWKWENGFHPTCVMGYSNWRLFSFLPEVSIFSTSNKLKSRRKNIKQETPNYDLVLVYVQGSTNRRAPGKQASCGRSGKQEQECCFLIVIRARLQHLICDLMRSRGNVKRLECQIWNRAHSACEHRLNLWPTRFKKELITSLFDS